ncbi:tRNA pseudouridine(55) synthase TruB [Kocuria sp. UBA5001]|uniref:tRNA pseudouridine(55) synthase TruB n=1 Tax=Kocuria sp. UBA5001 TaxID=1946674 RepID=UPI0039C8E76F
MTAREDVPSPAPSLPRVAGLVVVDKPLGWTSHDVVSRMRRLAGTRKVGHAGTLDPAASGVLVLGVERATKLLTYVTGADKTYETTIRLGAATVTDDAEGDVVRQAPPERLEALTEEQVRAAVGKLTGEIQQVPSSVSAIKVNGERSYARVRRGEDVELAARPVTVREFTVHTVTRPTDAAAVDLTATVTCTSGTYIRALARDLGEALGVGGHLMALRRTRVGSFTLEQAHTLEELTEQVRSGGTVSTVPLDIAARGLFPVRELSAVQATDLSHGRRIAAEGKTLAVSGDSGDGVVACFAPDGTLVALAEERGRGEKRYATSVLGIAAGVTFTDPAEVSTNNEPGSEGKS